MVQQHIYQFAVINTTKDITEESIAGFFIQDDNDHTLEIYTMTSAEGRMSIHNHSCFVQKDNQGRIRRFESRADAMEFYNRMVREFLIADIYATEGSMAGVSPQVVEEIGRYVYDYNAEGKRVPAKTLLEYCSQNRKIYNILHISENNDIFQ